jgi:hypothetical protein
MNQIREMLQTGKWEMHGTMSRPLLVPKTGE